ncbi:MAG: prevent-host-death protein [Castellaniella sp.]|uniref:prevent-host-death protein n=1 Tax=Castellaniella sp. TaxID=1955812 RepID=UPI003C756CF6
MPVTTTEAKNRFGHVCAQAKTAPVIVEKDGRPDSVIVFYADDLALTTAAPTRTLAQRRKAFNEAHQEWLAEQNRDFEQNSLWCDRLVVWQGQG